MTTPVIFIHGTSTSSEIFKAQESFLRQRGRPYLSVDLPGHGSRGQEEFSLPKALETIKQAAGQFKEPPLLVGVSLGAYLSLLYGLREHVVGTVLVGFGLPLPVFALSFVSMLLRRRKPLTSSVFQAIPQTKPRETLKKFKGKLLMVNGTKDPMRLGLPWVKLQRPTITHLTLPKAGHDANKDNPEAFNQVLDTFLKSNKI